jgi:hypothetical protein
LVIRFKLSPCFSLIRAWSAGWASDDEYLHENHHCKTSIMIYSDYGIKDGFIATARFHPAHDSILDFLVAKATPQEILAFELPEAERQRTIELLDKQDEGSLTSEEEAELDAIQQMDLLYIALRAKARRALREDE